MIGVILKRGNVDTDRDRWETQRGDSCLQAKEGGLEQILPLWHSEETNLGFLDFQPSEL